MRWPDSAAYGGRSIVSLDGPLAVWLAAGNPAATKVELVPQTGAVEIHLPPVSLYVALDLDVSARPNSCSRVLSAPPCTCSRYTATPR